MTNTGSWHATWRRVRKRKTWHLRTFC